MRRFVLLFCMLFLALACMARAGEPLRVASLAPNVTETIFALGQGDRVVAVSDFCVYPPEATPLPRIGGKFNPNIEALARLVPDLVFIQGEQPGVVQWARVAGARVIRLNMDSLAGIRTGIATIAEALGCEARGVELMESIQRDLDAVVSSVAGHERPRVFLALGGDSGPGGMFTAGSASFLSELLGIAGGENIFADLGRAYSEVSLESLMRRQPQVILDIRPGATIQLSPEDFQRWHALVPEARVLLLTEDFLLLPGPRAVQSARVLARALARPFHPDLAEVDDERTHP